MAATMNPAHRLFNNSSAMTDSVVARMTSSFGGGGGGDGRFPEVRICFRNLQINAPNRWRAVCAAVPQPTSSESTVMAGVVFQPFTELQKAEFQVSDAVSQSLARQRYHATAEAAVNDQINVEYNVSYIYHGLFAYFDRDNIGLPGFAKYFKESSEEEREDAERLIKYQNVRGGKVLLHSILTPAVLEFDHPEKGEALHAMELSLSLDKLVNEKLLAFHKVAQKVHDVQLQDFIETHYLEKQVERIKKVAQYVSQLRRVGKGHGVYHFDLVLRGEDEAGAGVEGL